MAGRKIIWSPRAKRKLYIILEFFADRNQSNIYSLKLYNLFHKELGRLKQNPELGIKTDEKNIRGLIVLDYTLFYEIKDMSIIIHSLWDNRQNPNDLVIK